MQCIGMQIQYLIWEAGVSAQQMHFIGIVAVCHYNTWLYVFDVLASQCDALHRPIHALYCIGFSVAPKQLNWRI
jgi:hypothetical protein